MLGRVLLIIAIILLIVMVVLYFLGKKAQKKKEEQDAQVAAAAQSVSMMKSEKLAIFLILLFILLIASFNIIGSVSMLIIDKKRMRLKDAGLPQQVLAQTNKLMQRSKLPIVKAKVGSRVMTFIADEKIFEEIPVKKEVKATVSGLYITGVRGLRGPLEKPQGKQKKSLRAKLQAQYDKANKKLQEEKQKK